jgi:hypothetical protein
LKSFLIRKQLDEKGSDAPGGPSKSRIAVAFLCSSGAAEQPPVTVLSPCECLDAHGKGRWAVKTDSSVPPTDASAVQAVLPSGVFGGSGIDVPLTMQLERTGIENKWFALTGRVIAVKVEADGDLHIALADATGDINRELSLLKYQQNRNRVHFVKRFSVGRQQDSRFTLALTEN